MKLYPYSYSNAYVPDMPMVELGVSRPGSRQPDQTVAAVIDSGNGPVGVTEINV